MEIRIVSVNDIKPAAYNPKVLQKPGDHEYEALKKSILSFGYIDPIIWNERTGNLVGGHLRFQVEVDLGATEIQVSVVNLDEAREKALNLALNKIHGQFDEEKLAVLLDELTKVPDFDIGLTGFGVPEIRGILDRFNEIKEDDFIADGEIIDVTEPVTQAGELIQLGKNWLLCGDSANPEHLKKLLGEAKIDLVVTDPPYRVAYTGQNRPLSPEERGKALAKREGFANDNLSSGEYRIWLRSVFSQVMPYLEDGAALYVWNGTNEFGHMCQMLDELGCHVSCVITWAKESFSLGFSDYHQATEHLVYSWKKSGSHKWFGPENESTLWEIKRDSRRSYQHLTQKPIALWHRMIRNSSARGGAILDLFMGSGSSLLAAQQLGRVCYGMEISRVYCDLIISRYISMFGKESVSEEIFNKYAKVLANHG